jgi:hypothetical protein
VDVPALGRHPKPVTIGCIRASSSIRPLKPEADIYAPLGMRARLISVGGLRYTAANTVLNRRKLPNPARTAISVIGKSVSSSKRFARCTRAVWAT